MNVVLLKPFETIITEKGIPILILNNIIAPEKGNYYIGLYNGINFQVNQDINYFKDTSYYNSLWFAAIMTQFKHGNPYNSYFSPYKKNAEKDLPKSVAIKTILYMLLIQLFPISSDDTLYKIFFTWDENREYTETTTPIIRRYISQVYDYIVKDGKGFDDGKSC